MSSFTRNLNANPVLHRISYYKEIAFFFLLEYFFAGCACEKIYYFTIPDEAILPIYLINNFVYIEMNIGTDVN